MVSSRTSHFAPRPEILGLGGIQGNGQGDVVRALFGLTPSSGRVTLTARPFASGRRRARFGLASSMCRAERHSEGLFLPHSIRENISTPHLYSWAGLGVVPAARERQVRTRHPSFAIRTPSSGQTVAHLSGGNQQRSFLGRWTAGSPRVFIFEDPTRGVDVATKLDSIGAFASGGGGRCGDPSRLGPDGTHWAAAIAFSCSRAGASSTKLRGPTPPKRNSSAAPRARGSLWRARPGVAEAASARGKSLGRTDDRTLRRRAAAGRPRVGARPRRVARLPVLLHLSQPIHIAGQVAPLALAALGQFSVILLGGIDLSVGPLISLVTAITSFAAVAEGGGGLAAAVALSLAAGLGTESVNAFLIIRLRIRIGSPRWRPIGRLRCRFDRSAKPGGLVSGTFIDFFSGSIGPVPVPALVLVIAIRCWPRSAVARALGAKALRRRIEQRSEPRGRHRRRPGPRWRLCFLCALRIGGWSSDRCSNG